MLISMPTRNMLGTVQNTDSSIFWTHQVALMVSTVERFHGSTHFQSECTCLYVVSHSIETLTASPNAFIVIESTNFISKIIFGPVSLTENTVKYLYY